MNAVMVKRTSLLANLLSSALNAGLYNKEEQGAAKSILKQDAQTRKIASTVCEQGLFLKISQVKSESPVPLFGQLTPSLAFNEIDLQTRDAETGDYHTLVSFRISDRALAKSMMLSNNSEKHPVTIFQAGNSLLEAYEPQSEHNAMAEVFDIFNRTKDEKKIKLHADALKEAGAKLDAERKRAILHGIERMTRANVSYSVTRFDKIQHNHYVDASIESANAIRSINTSGHLARLGCDNQAAQDAESSAITRYLKGELSRRDREVVNKAIEFELQGIADTYGLEFDITEADAFAKNILNFDNEWRLKAALENVAFEQMRKHIKALMALKNEMTNANILNHADHDFLQGGCLTMTISQGDYISPVGLLLPQVDIVRVCLRNAYEEGFYGEKQVVANDTVIEFALMTEDLILAIRGLNSDEPVQVNPSCVFGSHITAHDRASCLSMQQSAEVKDEKLLAKACEIAAEVTELLDKKGALKKAEKLHLADLLEQADALSIEIEASHRALYESHAEQINNRYHAALTKMVNNAALDSEYKEKVLQLSQKR